jgi:predicted membrane channel-forming protein YqfA (hemolysin III family)
MFLVIGYLDLDQYDTKKYKSLLVYIDRVIKFYGMSTLYHLNNTKGMD